MIKYKIQDITLNRIFKALWRRFVLIPKRIKWKYNLTSEIREQKAAINKLRDKHKGQRCFIIANGPSLSKIDFSLLKNEFTIGMNRIYLMKEKMGFLPNYLCVVDIPVQLKQFREEYDMYEGIKFLNFAASNLGFTKAENLYFFLQHFKNDFSPDFTKTVGNSKSVTQVCIQLAFYLGFDEVILIGKDHSYDIKGKAGNHIKANGKEKNHFITGYYNKGQIWAIPNYGEEEHTYSLARESYEKAGRRIVDATVEGKLEVFEKVDFYSLF